MKKDRFARRLQLVRTTVRRLSTNELSSVQGGGGEPAALAAGPTTTVGGGEVPTTCELRYTMIRTE
jgi:hypothetical protein